MILALNDSLLQAIAEEEIFIVPTLAVMQESAGEAALKKYGKNSLDGWNLTLKSN